MKLVIHQPFKEAEDSSTTQVLNIASAQLLNYYFNINFKFFIDCVYSHENYSISNYHLSGFDKHVLNDELCITIISFSTTSYTDKK